MSVSTKAHTQLSNEHRTETHLKVANGGNNKTLLFIYLEIATNNYLS